MNNNTFNAAFYYTPPLGDDKQRGGENIHILLQRYYETLCGKNLVKETKNYYIKHVKQFLNEVPDLTEESIQQYVRRSLERYEQNGNVARFFTIQRFLDFAGIDVKLPKVKIIDSGKMALSQEQVQHIFETLPNMSYLHQLVFGLLYFELRRPKEIRNLKIKNRNGDLLRYIGKTYHKNGILIEVISQWTQKAWDCYVEFERPEGKNQTEEEYLILNTCKKYYGKHWISNIPIHTRTHDIQKMSEVIPPGGEHFNPYLIRRTGITHQIKNTHDPKITQVQAGHMNLSTTMRYNRIQENDIREHLSNFEKEVMYQKTSFTPHDEIVNKTITNRLFPQCLNIMENEDNSIFSFSISFFQTLFASQRDWNLCNIKIWDTLPPLLSTDLKHDLQSLFSSQEVTA